MQPLSSIYFKCPLEVFWKKPDRLKQEEWLSHSRSSGLFESPPGFGEGGGVWWGLLEELQWLWRWQTHFRSSSGWGDRETLLQERQGSKRERWHCETLDFFCVCVCLLWKREYSAVLLFICWTLFLRVFVKHCACNGGLIRWDRRGVVSMKKKIVATSFAGKRDTDSQLQSRQEDVWGGGRIGKYSLECNLKLSSFIYRPGDSIMVHSLSRRSKHRKMLLISVCEAEDPLMSVMIPWTPTNHKCRCWHFVHPCFISKMLCTVMYG